ncbi:MAG: hypothetical protein M5U29_15270 [Anaerolineae bacterium]|nr:hypothetical protein [Anaerolineae bacterium]
MATEFTIVIQDRPGALAGLTEVLAQNAVNILAIHATSCTGEGVVQFVTDSPDATIEALKDGGFDYTTNNVLVVGLVHQPGALARLSRALASAQININAVYITMTGQVVLDVSDLTKAQQVAMSAGLY